MPSERPAAVLTAATHGSIFPRIKGKKPFKSSIYITTAVNGSVIATSQTKRDAKDGTSQHKVGTVPLHLHLLAPIPDPPVLE